MSTSQLNSVGTEVSTGIYLTLWISLCFIDPSLLGLVAEIMYMLQHASTYMRATNAPVLACLRPRISSNLRRPVGRPGPKVWSKSSAPLRLLPR